MGLIKSYEDEFGATHPEAYWDFSGLAYDTIKKIATIKYSIWHDKEAFNEGRPPLPNSATLTLDEKQTMFVSYGDFLASISHDGIRTLALTVIKQSPDFKDCPDA